MGTEAKEAEKRQEFEELTHQHLNALYRFALQKVRDASQAADLVQETCLKAYRAFERFERGTNSKAWLFRILANTALDWQRKASTRPIEVSLEAEDSLVDPPVEAALSRLVDPERQLMTRSLADRVEAVVGELPQDWQAVVLLSFVEGYSYKEIAEILGCPIGTVMSRLYRARQVLRHRLARYLEVDGNAESEPAPDLRASVTPIELLRDRSKSRGKTGEG